MKFAEATTAVSVRRWALSDLLSWLSDNLVAVAAVVGGVGSAWRWLDGHAADRKQQRERRYWELLDISIGKEEGVLLRGRQIAALHLMAEYHEYRHITILEDALSRDASPWTIDHRERVGAILGRLKRG